MNQNDRTGFKRIGYQRIALLFVVLTFTFVIWPVGILWPSGGVWHEAGRSAYMESIRGIYAAVSLPEDRLP